jgi:acyl CoA:acetate/3-ketoacid CoA transferase alpha subunit
MTLQICADPAAAVAGIPDGATILIGGFGDGGAVP